jgi:hypothetical protein
LTAQTVAFLGHIRQLGAKVDFGDKNFISVCLVRIRGEKGVKIPEKRENWLIFQWSKYPHGGAPNSRPLRLLSENPQQLALVL